MILTESEVNFIAVTTVALIVLGKYDAESVLRCFIDVTLIWAHLLCMAR